MGHLHFCMPQALCIAGIERGEKIELCGIPLVILLPGNNQLENS